VSGPLRVTSLRFGWNKREGSVGILPAYTRRLTAPDHIATGWLANFTSSLTHAALSIPYTLEMPLTRGTRLRQGFVGQAPYASVRRDARTDVENHIPRFLLTSRSCGTDARPTTLGHKGYAFLATNQIHKLGKDLILTAERPDSP
jgi:hypothetical protein